MVIFLVGFGVFWFFFPFDFTRAIPKGPDAGSRGLGPAHASSCLHPPRPPDLRRPRELCAVALNPMLKSSLPLPEATGNFIWEICAAWAAWLALCTRLGRAAPAQLPSLAMASIVP